MNNIKKIRKRRGFSQQYLATLSGIKYKSSVSRIENNKVKPTFATLKKISKILGCKIEDFYDI